MTAASPGPSPPAYIALAGTEQTTVERIRSAIDRLFRTIEMVSVTALIQVVAPIPMLAHRIVSLILTLAIAIWVLAPFLFRLAVLQRTYRGERPLVIVASVVATVGPIAVMTAVLIGIVSSLSAAIARTIH